ncbi:MAG: hypothetical protein Q9174_005686, partial [Haloplaca sp. 1 TL-2023]
LPTWHIKVAILPGIDTVDGSLRTTVFESGQNLDNMIDLLGSRLPVAQNLLPAPKLEQQEEQEQKEGHEQQEGQNVGMEFFQQQISSLAEKMEKYRQDVRDLRMGGYDYFVVDSQPGHAKNPDWKVDEENVKLVIGERRLKELS